MASEVQICNLALRRVGAIRISSLTEGTRESELCQDFYEFVRDELLGKQAWNFAMARAALAMPVGTVPGQWTYQYQLPSDCLKALWIDAATGGKLTNFVIEGSLLLADVADAVLVYTQRITDPTRFKAHFVNALAARLAAELTIPLTHSNTLFQATWALYERALAEARVADANEGRDYKEADRETDSWLSVRD